MKPGLLIEADSKLQAKDPRLSIFGFEGDSKCFTYYSPTGSIFGAQLCFVIRKGNLPPSDGSDFPLDGIKQIGKSDWLCCCVRIHREDSDEQILAAIEVAGKACLNKFISGPRISALLLPYLLYRMQMKWRAFLAA